MAASRQAQAVWRRFCAFYGADVVERKYGVQPPADWCVVIDEIDSDRIDGVLADIRSKHPAWPPGLSEFESISKAAAKPRHSGPTMQEMLTDFVLRSKSLTSNQLTRPWKFLYSGYPGCAGDPNDHTTRPSSDFAITGVVIPADGDAPGHRVMVIDMRAEAA